MIKNRTKQKRIQKLRRITRTRKSIIGSERPRLSVFRSLNHISAQIIDDAKGVTLVSAHDREAEKVGKKVDRARETGRILAKKAKEKGISSVVFDRRGYKYHGRVRAFAEGAREAGLKF